MADGLAHPRLAQEAPHVLGLRGQVGVQHLDGHLVTRVETVHGGLDGG